MAASSNPWLKFPCPRPAAALRLFCFPYAGAGASVLQAWGDSFSPDVEVGIVQLPGREYRIGENPFWHLDRLVAAMAPHLEPSLDKPYAVFGHSLGALIGFEWIRSLRRAGQREPLHLFVSAKAAPQIPLREPPKHQFADEALAAELRKLGGTPETVLGNRELMEMFLPIVRADFSLNETYVHHTEPPLNCPITVFGGKHDAEVPVEDLAGWKVHTRGLFQMNILDGDHFFLHDLRPTLIRLIERAICPRQVDQGYSVNGQRI